MLSMIVRDANAKAELYFDKDENGIYFTVLVDGNQYDFEITGQEWESLKTFLEVDKTTKQDVLASSKESNHG